jgi:hypothetical protein
MGRTGRRSAGQGGKPRQDSSHRRLIVCCQIAKVRVQTLPKAQAVDENAPFEDHADPAALLRNHLGINKDGPTSGQYYASPGDRHYGPVEDPFAHLPVPTPYEENRRFPWGQ